MWIIRHTSNRLTIWRTFGLSSSYLNALRALFAIGMFVFLTGQLQAVNCHRLEAGGPIDCEVTIGTIFFTTTQSLTDVHDVRVKQSSKSYAAVLIHADGETTVGSFDYRKVVSGISKFIYEKAARSLMLIDDLRWLGWLGFSIVGSIALIGLIYTLFGDALVTVNFDKRADTITLSQRFWLGKQQISQRTITTVTDISLRQRRGKPCPQVTVLFGKERCLPLWETPEAPQMAELIHRFLDLPTVPSPVQRSVTKHKRVTE